MIRNFPERVSGLPLAFGRDVARGSWRLIAYGYLVDPHETGNRELDIDNREVVSLLNGSVGILHDVMCA